MDSLVRLRQIHKPDVSGYVVEILNQYLSGFGITVGNTGTLTGAFYPLRQNPSGYLTSASGVVFSSQTGDFLTPADLIDYIGQVIIQTDSLYSRVKVTGSSTITGANFTGVGTVSIYFQNGTIFVSGIASGAGAATGNFYPSTGNPTGYLTNSSPVVFQTGNQGISGNKQFYGSITFDNTLNVPAISNSSNNRVDINAAEISDSFSVLSIDWGNRTLRNTAGTTVIDWDDLRMDGLWSFPSGILVSGNPVITGIVIRPSDTGQFYPRVGNPSQFITASQTGVFYPRTNPSGYIQNNSTGSVGFYGLVSIYGPSGALNINGLSRTVFTCWEPTYSTYYLQNFAGTAFINFGTNGPAAGVTTPIITGFGIHSTGLNHSGFFESANRRLIGQWYPDRITVPSSIDTTLRVFSGNWSISSGSFTISGNNVVTGSVIRPSDTGAFISGFVQIEERDHVNLPGICFAGNEADQTYPIWGGWLTNALTNWSKRGLFINTLTTGDITSISFPAAVTEPEPGFAGVGGMVSREAASIIRSGTGVAVFEFTGTALEVPAHAAYTAFLIARLSSSAAAITGLNVELLDNSGVWTSVFSGAPVFSGSVVWGGPYVSFSNFPCRGAKFSLYLNNSSSTVFLSEMGIWNKNFIRGAHLYTFQYDNAFFRDVIVSGAFRASGLATISGQQIITAIHTGNFYPRTGNPSGFVQNTQTGIFATTEYVTGVSGVLRSDLISSGSYLFNLIQVSSTGVSSLNGMSGIIGITGTGAVTVSRQGQTIYVSGHTDGITGGVLMTGNQTIQGIKRFTNNVVISGGASLLTDSIVSLTNSTNFIDVFEGGLVGNSDQTLDWENAWLIKGGNITADWGLRILSGDWTLSGSRFLLKNDSQVFTTGIPVGVDNIFVLYPSGAFSKTPKVFVSVEVTGDMFYSVAIRSPNISGFTAIFSDTINENGVILHTYATIN